MVQWLRLCTPNSRDPDLFLRELRSHVPHLSPHTATTEPIALAKPTQQGAQALQQRPCSDEINSKFLKSNFSQRYIIIPSY